MKTDHRPGEGFSKPLGCAVVVGAVFAVVALTGWAFLSSGSVTIGWGPPEEPPSTTNACGMAKDLYGRCDESTGETRPANPERHFDRLPFDGDRESAERVAAEVALLLEPLRERDGTPTVEEVKDALGDFASSAQVWEDVVHLDGIGFGIQSSGGCVYGDIYEGEVNIDISGPIRDGGCLAMYGH